MLASSPTHALPRETTPRLWAPWRRITRRVAPLLDNPATVVACGTLFVLVCLALALAPWLAPYDPAAAELHHAHPGARRRRVDALRQAHARRRPRNQHAGLH